MKLTGADAPMAPAHASPNALPLTIAPICCREHQMSLHLHVQHLRPQRLRQGADTHGLMHAADA